MSAALAAAVFNGRNVQAKKRLSCEQMGQMPELRRTDQPQEIEAAGRKWRHRAASRAWVDRAWQVRQAAETLHKTPVVPVVPKKLETPSAAADADYRASLTAFPAVPIARPCPPISARRKLIAMNAILLTVLALGGADASASYGGGYGGPGYGAAAYGGDAGGYCDSCNNGGHCRRGCLHGCLHEECNKICDYLGPMPQSCYNPSFGCYPSTRFMNRYPAFHNYYYRAAYNYRHYFDYPWHAGLHEPTSMFSYPTPGEAPAQGVPTPLPESAYSAPSSGVRTAAGFASVRIATSDQDWES